VSFLKETRWAGLADQNCLRGLVGGGYPLLSNRQAIPLEMGVTVPLLQSLDFVEASAWHLYSLLLPTREALVLSVVSAYEG